MKRWNNLILTGAQQESISKGRAAVEMTSSIKLETQ